MRNFKSAIFTSTKSGITISGDENCSQPVSQTKSRVGSSSSNGEGGSGPSEMRQRRSSTASSMNGWSAASGNQQLRKMSCVAIALSGNASSGDQANLSKTVTPVQVFRRHSAVQRAERAKEHGEDSSSPPEHSSAHMKKMRGQSQALQAPQEGFHSQSEGKGSESSQGSLHCSSEGSGGEQALGLGLGVGSSSGGRARHGFIVTSDHSHDSQDNMTTPSNVNGVDNSVVSVCAMQQQECGSSDDDNKDEDEDAFDSDISDNEVSVICHPAHF